MGQYLTAGPTQAPLQPRKAVPEGSQRAKKQAWRPARRKRRRVSKTGACQSRPSLLCQYLIPRGAGWGRGTVERPGVGRLGSMRLRASDEVLRQDERVKNVFDGDDEVLAVVEQVGHGRGHQPSAHVKVPESFARSRIESEQVAGIVRGKQQMPGGGQDPRDAFPIAEFVIPHDFASAVVQRAQRGIGPQIMVATAPAFRLSRGRAIKNAEESARIDVKKTRLRIKHGSRPVGG